MHILLTDETNLNASNQAKFFVYGGLFLDAEQLPLLTDRITSIRANAGYQPTDEFKFDTRSRPAHVTIALAKDAKRQTIKACQELQCRFIANLVLHDIAKKKPQAALIEYGMNTVISQFHQYLREHDKHGIVAVDRLTNHAEYQLLAKRFTTGLELHTKTSVPLGRVHLFSATCTNASHASSALDIVLGAFRYCINDKKATTAAMDMMKTVVPLLWHERDGENIYALERGLVFRPKKVQVPAYQTEYDNLLKHINTLLKAQP